MVLQNYVILEEGIPARVHFYNHVIERRTITDPQTGSPVERQVLVLDVDRLNNQAVSAKYSTMSQKHADQFAAYLPNRGYANFDFVITMLGTGFRRSWTVQVIPLK